MPLCGNLILKEHAARTSWTVTLRREVASLPSPSGEAGDSVLLNGAPGTRDIEHARLGIRAGRRQSSWVAGVRALGQCER